MSTNEVNDLLTEQEKRDLFKSRRHQDAIDAIAELQDDLIKPIAQRAMETGDVATMQEVIKRLPEKADFHRVALQSYINLANSRKKED
jgi:hypothetical protein